MKAVTVVVCLVLLVLSLFWEGLAHSFLHGGEPSANVVKQTAAPVDGQIPHPATTGQAPCPHCGGHH